MITLHIPIIPHQANIALTIGHLVLVVQMVVVADLMAVATVFVIMETIPMDAIATTTIQAMAEDGKDPKGQIMPDSPAFQAAL